MYSLSLQKLSVCRVAAEALVPRAEREVFEKEFGIGETKT